MDWRSYLFVLFTLLLPLTHCWSTTINNFAEASRSSRMHQKNEVSPYLDLVLCPIRNQPWSCARQQSGRILDVWDSELQTQWRKLKVEADHQLNSTIERRGYSASEVLTKEKPSTILKKIEIGTSFMKEYLAQTMDGFLGREYDYGIGTKSEGNVEYEDQDETDTDGDADEDHEDDDDDDDQTENESEHNEDNDEKINENENEDEDNSNKSSAAAMAAASAAAAASNDDASNGVEFIEIEGTAANNNNNNNNGQLKKPGGGGNKNKRKKGNKGQPATVLIVQEDNHGHGGHDDNNGHGGGHMKQKRKKRKKHQHGAAEAVETIVIEQEPSDHLGIGLLEELAGADLLSSGGGKRKKKQHPSKYGRSNGVTRGKKKKKKKALAKLVLLGTFLKAKIELLLKLLGAHLQIKFFAIALIGLLINIARFWIDVKRGGAPQKVVYVEHAHHQHHYEETGGDDWGEQGGGGYWKRSLQTDPTIEENGAGASTDSYQPKQQPYDPAAAQYMAYRNQWQ